MRKRPCDRKTALLAECLFRIYCSLRNDALSLLKAKKNIYYIYLNATMPENDPTRMK